ncbi:MAG: magnesium transporter [Ruminococcaceae bacterium]|nr:magnesium transporter [Oscillospiraceae bacterium]
MERKFEYLEELLDNRRYADFRADLAELNPVDAADFFYELNPHRIPAVFKLLDKDTAAAVFAELEIEVQERIITAMTDREISLIVEELALDDTTELLKELPANMVHRIMKNATPETRTDINRLLAYPEDSAGSVMTAEFIDLRRDMTCAEAIARIRKTGVDKETVYVAYVVDHHRVLQGAVPLKDLLFASADDLIEDIMDEDIICASTMDDQETVASTVAKYDLLAIPIVDREYRLVGIVTVDDAIDVMETEATEDIEKMAAISPTDKPYLRTGVFETWKKRVPWLLLLMLSATFTSTILAHYEGILDAATLSLAVFVPMLTGTGGNASSQTSVTVIRGLSLGEIEMRDIFRVLWKELRVASVCGITVAAACFAKTMLVDLKLVFTVDTIEVAAIVSATMFCAVVFAKLMGVLLPIGAKRVGLDPAVMASPFITTIVDTLTLLIYVGIASAVLPI